jgi:hypothetical protein
VAKWEGKCVLYWAAGTAGRETCFDDCDGSFVPYLLFSVSYLVMVLQSERLNGTSHDLRLGMDNGVWSLVATVCNGETASKSSRFFCDRCSDSGPISQ